MAESLLGRTWRYISNLSVLHWLWQVAISGLVTWLSRKWPMMASPNDFLGSFLATITVFCGTLASTISLTRLSVWTVQKIRFSVSPPGLEVTAQSGQRAAVELQHSGQPITWEARMRILAVLNGQAEISNPDPLWRQCHIEKDGRSARSVKLAGGDVANIFLAEARRSHPLSSNREIWLSVPNIDGQHDTRVDGDPLIELNLTTVPRIEQLSIRKCFRVKWSEVYVIECIEVPCR